MSSFSENTKYATVYPLSVGARAQTLAEVMAALPTPSVPTPTQDFASALDNLDELVTSSDLLFGLGGLPSAE